MASHEYEATTFEAMSVFSRSKAARWRSGERTCSRRRPWRSEVVRPAALGPHAGLGDDRRQVDLLHVGRPVDGAGVEAEGLPVDVVEGLPAGQQVVDAVDGLALGVGAVELDVADGALGLLPLVLQAGRELGLLAPQGEGGQDPVGPFQGGLGPPELGLHPAPAGERPVAGDDGLALPVVERVLLEPARGQVDQLAVAEGVGRARGHLGDVDPAVGRRPGAGDGADGGGDLVDRDDVDDALGHAGELLQQAAGVGDDDRLGHAEAPDPARLGLRPGRLDDRRAHDADRDVAPGLAQGPFARGPWCRRRRRASRARRRGPDPLRPCGR